MNRVLSEGPNFQVIVRGYVCVGGGGGIVLAMGSPLFISQGTFRL